MKTLFNIDYKNLAEYQDYKRVNSDWNIQSYLNTFYDTNAAIAFSKFYFPDFIEKEKCVILGFRYDEDIFKAWFNKLNGHINEVEKMCNLYELKDFFHINDLEFSNEGKLSEKYELLGKALKLSWSMNLRELYPERNFCVDLFSEDGNNYITLYSL